MPSILFPEFFSYCERAWHINPSSFSLRKFITLPVKIYSNGSFAWSWKVRNVDSFPVSRHSEFAISSLQKYLPEMYCSFLKAPYVMCNSMWSLSRVLETLYYDRYPYICFALAAKSLVMNVCGQTVHLTPGFESGRNRCR